MTCESSFTFIAGVRQSKSAGVRQFKSAGVRQSESAGVRQSEPAGVRQGGSAGVRHCARRYSVRVGRRNLPRARLSRCAGC